MLKASAIIVAGGKGIRMGGNIRKQYLEISGQPLLCHTLRAFGACPSVEQIFLVVPAADTDFCRKSIVSPLSFREKIRVVRGGKERQDSVYNGLLAAEAYGGIAVIHDGVRPFVLPEQIQATIDCAAENGAAMLGIPAFDTLKQVNESKEVEKTLDRTGIWLAQTPQTFSYDLIRNAHEWARQSGYFGTDDASLIERTGRKVRMIAGSRFNIKITTPEDLRFAQAIYPLFQQMSDPNRGTG
ncbi:MAG: 2-C-methyl-D-erythritol 4-phosphate cytidylyltransferase [Desulfobacterales bacterium]